MTVAIDTNIALLHLGGRLDEPLPDGPWIVSVITELEMLSYGALEEGAEAQIRAFLGKVRVIELSPLVRTLR